MWDLTLKLLLKWAQLCQQILIWTLDYETTIFFVWNFFLFLFSHHIMQSSLGPPQCWSEASKKGGRRAEIWQHFFIYHSGEALLRAYRMNRKIKNKDVSSIRFTLVHDSSNLKNAWIVDGHRRLLMHRSGIFWSWHRLCGIGGHIVESDAPNRK